MPVAGEQCSTCKFRVNNTCHRSPPAPITVKANVQTVVVWPITADDNWCGEWTRKPQ